MSIARRVVYLLSIMALLILGCQKEDDAPVNEPVRKATGIHLSIVSGSENKLLEPIIQKFARQEGALIDVEYRGSVDISREISAGVAGAYDAVWPASSLWISLGDTQGVIKYARSIMRSPVVFGVKKPVAQRLGWIGKEVSVQNILDAVEAREIRFAMTSATQSNSGASAFFGYLSAFAGQPEVLTLEHLRDPDVADKIKRFLRRVDRSSGSSGWLKELFLREYAYFDGMVNYEALIIEANRELGPNQDPIYVIYPIDGMVIADSPLGYVNKGDASKEALFLKLQNYLLSPEVQKQLLQLGRRTGLTGVNPEGVDKRVFNPDWGIDITRVISPIRTPASAVVQEALNLYQTAFRKPSLTAFVLDYSGSMEGEGERQLEKAMRTLLDPEVASQFLLQASPEDLTVIIPFNNRVIDLWQAEGNDPAVLRELLHKVEDLDPGGGTNMYYGVADAFRTLAARENLNDYHAAVIVMSDGMSDGKLSWLQRETGRLGIARDIPVFTILFGAAEPNQMKVLAEFYGGRMFDGRKNVVNAFRKAKGYN